MIDTHSKSRELELKNVGMTCMLILSCISFPGGTTYHSSFLLPFIAPRLSAQLFSHSREKVDEKESVDECSVA
jgi:hypothetical protein